MTTTTNIGQASRNHGDGLLKDYMIIQTIDWIRRCHFSIVGLQFPDELLPISVPIFRSLLSHLSKDQVELYIMADTTYGSCCVDQVAAQHVNANAVVHYGPACLSIPSSLPVFYVLPKLPLSDHLIQLTAHAIFNSLQSSDLIISKNHPDNKVAEKILMMYDVGYHWKSETIADCLKVKYNLPIVRHKLDLVESTVYSTPVQPQQSNNNSSRNNSCHNQQASCQSNSCCQDTFETEPHDQPTCGKPAIQQLDCKEEAQAVDSIDDTINSSIDSTVDEKIDYSNYQAVIYIGDESPRLTHFLVTHPDLPVIVVDPNEIEKHLDDHQSIHSSPQTQSKRANRLLMRRYATIQKARDGDVFGIIVGTLGVKNYLSLIHKTKEMIEEKYKKKAYIISVGKLKPEKLMNFAEIETWVLIDCPESSLLLLDGKTGQKYDPKSYGAPIITPWELEIALASCDHQSESNNNNHSRGAWDGKLVLDFDRILSAWQPDPIQNINHDPSTDTHHDEDPSDRHGPMNQQDPSDPDAPVFSLVTGGYKYRKNWNQNPQSDSKELIQINSTGSQELIQSIKGAAGEFALSKRSYRGLDPRFGLDPPAEIEIGRVGIAKAYQDDHHS